jgi:hypothetical protein
MLKAVIVCSTAFIIGVAAFTPAVAAGPQRPKEFLAPAPLSNAAVVSTNDVYLNSEQFGADPDLRISCTYCATRARSETEQHQRGIHGLAPPCSASSF